MGLSYAKGSFQWLAADALNTLYTITGLSFQPTALRFYMTGLSSTTSAGSTSTHQRTSGGFATSPSSRACVCSQDQDAAATMTCTSGYRTDAVLATVTSTPAFDGMLDLDSIQSDGFKCIVDDVVPVDVTVFWEAWGGTTVAAVVSIAEPAATGNVDYTVTGFDGHGAGDQVVMFFGVQSVSAAGTAERNDSGFMIGYATGGASGENIVITCNNDDGSANSDTDDYGLNGECLAMILVAGGNPSARAQLTQFGTDNFRLNWIARGTTSRRYIALAIKGGYWKAGSYTIDITAINHTATVTGLPFSPIGIDIIGQGNAVSTAGTSVGTGHLEWGCGISPSDRLSTAVRNDDGSAAAAVELRFQYDAILHATNTSAAERTATDLNSVTSDGFQVIVDVADATQSAVEWQGYLAFGKISARDIQWTFPRMSPSSFGRLRR